MRAIVRALLLIVLLCVSALAESPSHVLMLDVSGSMRDRGYADREKWGATVLELTGKLFAPGGRFFGPEDSLTVVPFSDPDSDQREGRQPWQGTLASFDPARLPLPGGGATDMSRCLDLALEHAPELIWILTDNENNLSGNRSDREFYERLADDPAFPHVYFFPLADPEQGGDALVMYLLVRGDSGASVDELASEVKRRTGYEGVLFRPLYGHTGRSVLDVGKELSVDTAEVEQEGGTTVLWFEEGDELAGQLRFKVRSRLKGWKIVDATMEKAEVELDVPDSYSEGAGKRKYSRQVTPQKLSVDAGQESAEVFVLDLAAQDPPIRLERPFLSSPFASTLDVIPGKVALKATLELSKAGLEEGDLRPSLTPELKRRMAQVPNLAQIEELMVYQGGQDTEDRRTIAFERQLEVRTRASPLSALVVGGVLAALGALALLLFFALWGWKTAYRLEGPGEDEEFSLPYLAGSYTVIAPNGSELCRLKHSFGTLSAAPFPEVEANGSPAPSPVRWEGPEARLELRPEGKEPLFYTLVRAHKSGGAAGERDEVSI